MSFISSPARREAGFELIAESLLHQDGLAFASALTAEHFEEAMIAEGVELNLSPINTRDDDAQFNQAAKVYTPAVTLWAMISQAIFTGVMRSCAATVQRIAMYYALLGVEVSPTNTGGYTRARRLIPEGVVRRLSEGVALRCENEIPVTSRMFGLRTFLVDGTTISMPDTEMNQEEYPQPNSQEEGLGFPIMRLTALTSLATGMVMGMAHGKYAGKETGETALLRQLFPHLRTNDLVLMDRYYAGWFTLALLQRKGVHFVTRLHQLRTADFSTGKRLGKHDHIVTWPKPPKPDWMDPETYDGLPSELTIREIEVNVDIPGFRTEKLIVVTSLIDHKIYSRNDIRQLYRDRWRVELHIRDIKQTMQLNVLRCKTPAAVRQELWTGILAYNLVRHAALQSATSNGLRPSQISFAGTLQMITNSWMIGIGKSGINQAVYDLLVKQRIENGRSRRVGNRPNRVEPRAVKRRPAPLALLTEPRSVAQARLLGEQPA